MTLCPYVAVRFPLKCGFRSINAAWLCGIGSLQSLSYDFDRAICKGWCCCSCSNISPYRWPGRNHRNWKANSQKRIPDIDCPHTYMTIAEGIPIQVQIRNMPFAQFVLWGCHVHFSSDTSYTIYISSKYHRDILTAAKLEINIQDQIVIRLPRVRSFRWTTLTNSNRPVFSSSILGVNCIIDSGFKDVYIYIYIYMDMDT